MPKTVYAWDVHVARAEEFSIKATQLSNELEEVAHALEQLPGKLSVSVWNDTGTLSFERGSREGWQLVFDAYEGEAGERIVKYPNILEAPVEIKAHAACLVPELLEKLFAMQEERLKQVEEGLSSIATSRFRGGQKKSPPEK